MRSNAGSGLSPSSSEPSESDDEGESLCGDDVVERGERKGDGTDAPVASERAGGRWRISRIFRLRSLISRAWRAFVASRMAFSVDLLVLRFSSTEKSR